MTFPYRGKKSPELRVPFYSTCISFISFLELEEEGKKHDTHIKKG